MPDASPKTFKSYHFGIETGLNPIFVMFEVTLNRTILELKQAEEKRFNEFKSFKSYHFGIET